MIAQITIDDITYEYDSDLLHSLQAAFDVWRDGLGKLSGVLGRAAFLRGTSDIVFRSIAPERFDPFKQTRYLRILRATLARRPRSAKSNVVLPPLGV